MKLQALLLLAISTLALATATGCAYIPETRQREQIHNPFPQLKRVAIIPFYNQSSEPTVDTDLVSEQYYAALQSVPGFEVLPVGVAKAQWMQFAVKHGEPRSGAEFQQLAKQMGVEAIVVGSVTDFDAYYPPRMALTVHWYAANEGFHPIPAGYGLPWGTEQEEQIPKRIAREAEFELARSQLATQSPLSGNMVQPATAEIAPASGAGEINHSQRPATDKIALNGPDSNVAPQPPIPVDDPFDDPFGDAPRPDPLSIDGQTSPGAIETARSDASMTGQLVHGEFSQHQPYADYAPYAEYEPPLPEHWPSPTDLIPDPPSPVRPVASINHKPVLSHTRLYRGDDIYFTNRLADYVETGDDARPGSWQGYLKRSDDFVRFCCHLHITEMLESRGGSEQSDLILRWPLSRY